MQNFVKYSDLCLSFERRFSRHHFVKQNTERPNIRTRSCLTACLLTVGSSLNALMVTGRSLRAGATLL